MFPNISAVSLHLLDLGGNEEGLKWLKMETEDLALHLLHQVQYFSGNCIPFNHIRRKIKPSNYSDSQVTVHTHLEEAFQEADVILLLDEWWSDDGDTESEKVKGISDRYREYGQLIDTRANKEVKVIVSGDSFVNLRCSLLLDSARSIDSRQFVAVATQVENEARAIIAKKLKVRTSGSYIYPLYVPIAFEHFSRTMTHFSLSFYSRYYKCHCVGKYQW